MVKIVKTLSFNPSLADEEQMLNHIKGRIFAAYVKRLIWSDMRGNYTNNNTPTVNIDVVNDTSYMDELV